MQLEELSPSRTSSPFRIDPHRPTRVGLVGAGFIADFHLEILSDTPDVELVAICDRDEERAQRAAERYGARAVTTIAALAEAGVQVAHLCVPPDLHASLTRECLEAGIGVFVEKPLALFQSDARELANLAHERGLPLGVNHNAVFFPSFAKLMSRVRAGWIGSVKHVQVTLSVPLRQLDAGDYSHWMFREPRNIVFEQAPHPLSQVCELIGGVKSCETTILESRELLPGQTFHSRWSAAAVGERGTAEIYMSFGEPFTRSTVQVLGSDGSLQADVFHNHLEGERKTLWLDFFNTFLAGFRRGSMLRRSAWRVLFQYFGQTLGLTRREDGFYAGMRESMRAFHKALRENAPLPSDGERGVQVIEWCEALASAAEPATPQEALPDPGPARPGEVVVLGGTGFIGRRVVERLVERDQPVTVMVRRTHSLPQVLTDGARSGKVRLIRGSLENEESLRAILEGASRVIHLATGGGDDWETIQRSMVGGTRTVARACAERGVDRLIYVSSTAALYLGHDRGEEYVEDSLQTDPMPDGRALYSRGKIAAEEALLEVAAETGLPVSIARPGVVLGPGTPMQHSGIGLWVRDNHCVGWGLGNAPLPLVLADDVAEALVRAALHEGKELDGAAFNLACRAPITAAEMVAEMRRVTGRDLHFHPRHALVSQTMEIGKWIVKQVGGRRDAPFPSWRDLKSRELRPTLVCQTARNVLGWRPVDDKAEFLRRALSAYRA